MDKKPSKQTAAQKAEQKNKGIHDGHRAKMRSRFRKTGLESFQPHEIAEMMMYYPIPRKDTNPLGHLLIDRFGSVHGILRATEGELRMVQGMTENAITFVMFLRELYKDIVLEQETGADLSQPEARCRFFQELYASDRSEIVYAAFLDSCGNLIACERIGAGHPTATTFNIRTLTKLSIDLGSNHVILAHNHPTSLAEPSSADCMTTRKLLSILETNSIRLVDHIIVGRGNAISMAATDTVGLFGRT